MIGFFPFQKGFGLFRSRYRPFATVSTRFVMPSFASSLGTVPSYMVSGSTGLAYFSRWRASSSKTVRPRVLRSCSRPSRIASNPILLHLENDAPIEHAPPWMFGRLSARTSSKSIYSRVMTHCISSMQRMLGWKKSRQSGTFNPTVERADVLPLRGLDHPAGDPHGLDVDDFHLFLPVIPAELRNACSVEICA